MPGNLRDSSDRLITRWVRGEPGELAPENRALLEELEDRVRDGEQERVIDIVGHWHPIDLAELLLYLPIKLARRLYSWLPSSAAVDVLVEVSTDLRVMLLEDADVGQIVEIAAGLEEDDAVELLDDLPDTIAADVLERLPDRLLGPG